MFEPEAVGWGLYKCGWDQGCLVSMKCAQGYPSIWDDQKPDLDTADEFIVISQTCDLIKPLEREPYVDVLRVFWTSEKGLINESRSNSRRYHLVQVKRGADGRKEGLIADAADRRRIEKTALQGIAPRACLRPGDREWFRFRNWLAARYNRQVVPNDEVEAIHQPVAKAVKKLRKQDPIRLSLDDIDEIIYQTESMSAPYRLKVVFLRRERGKPSPEEEERAAEVADWLARILGSNGRAGIAGWKLLSVDDLSYGYYLDATLLDLDHYSLPEDDVATPAAASTSNAES